MLPLKKLQLILLIQIVVLQLNAQQKKDIHTLFNHVEFITGKTDKLNTHYNTAGDKLYMIGHQDGSFPDIGWHVKGEMGGIWKHPIKLLDGFEAIIYEGNEIKKLDKATSFHNYPFGNKHVYEGFSDNVDVERYQVVPDQLGAIYIEYLFKNKTNQPIEFQFEIKAISNLMPVWLGERTGMVDSKDQTSFDAQNNYWVVKDKENPWYVVYGSTIKTTQAKELSSKTSKPNTSTTSTTYTITIQPNDQYSIPFLIAGSSKNKEEALTQYQRLKENSYNLINQKKQRVLELDQSATLTLNDKEIETTFRWLKYNSDWLAIEVDGIGKGVVAGLPDYPWWFGGDMVYTLRGLITTGRKDLVYSTIDLIHAVSEKNNGNGRIIHEVSTNGSVYNLGLISETPQFASLIWDIFCWTGDITFLKKYFPTIEKGLEWLLKENDLDGNLIADGHGMMEIQGLDSEMIDVAAYAQRAFAEGAKMARLLGKKELAEAYEMKAIALKEKINTIFWDESFDSYADFIGTKEQALKLTDEAIQRAEKLNNKWAVEELKATKEKIKSEKSNEKKSFVLYHNWVVNTPMETGVADKGKALSALNTAQKFTNPYGMFVTGIDKNEKADQVEDSYAATTNKDEFTYTGTVMTLPTGVQIVAENNYGRPDEAYKLLKKVTKTFSYALPGSMYEVSPDYGMMTQAWNIFAYGEPIIEQFFGIHPSAYKKEINLKPMLPEALTEGKIQDLIIGNNKISVGFSTTSFNNSFSVQQEMTDWVIYFSQPKGKYKKWIVNNKVIQPKSMGELEQIELKGKINEIRLSQ